MFGKKCISRLWGFMLDLKSSLTLFSTFTFLLIDEKSETIGSWGSLAVKKRSGNKNQCSCLSKLFLSVNCQLPNDPLWDVSPPPPHQLCSPSSKTCSPTLLLLSRLFPSRSRPPPSPPPHPRHFPRCLHRRQRGRRTLNQDVQNCSTNIYIPTCFLHCIIPWYCIKSSK